MSKKNKFLQEMSDLELLEKASIRFLGTLKRVMTTGDFTDGERLGLIHSLEGAVEDWERKGGRI